MPHVGDATEQPAHPAGPVGTARSPAGRRRGPGRDYGVRRLPHRPACRRWRIATSEASDRSRPRDRRTGRRHRPRCDGAGGRHAGWYSLARAHLRGLFVLRAGAGKSLRSSAVHRIYPRPRRSPTRASCSRCRNGGDDVATAPLLCAGLIGWRSLRMAGEGRRIELYGFGAAAHIIAQVARAQGRDVFAFTRPGDVAGQDFARTLGACWTGSSDEAPPDLLDCAIIFARSARSCRRLCARCARAVASSAREFT